MGVSGRRYYSPSQGRFLGRDTIEERGGRNLYSFCGNNSVNRWDVLGMIPEQAPASGYQWELESTDANGNDTWVEVGSYGTPEAGQKGARITVMAPYTVAASNVTGFQAPNGGWINLNDGGSAPSGIAIAPTIADSWKNISTAQDLTLYLAFGKVMSKGSAQEFFQEMVLATIGSFAGGLVDVAATMTFRVASETAGVTTLYRAVMPGEAADIAATGVLRNPTGVEVKYFSTAIDGAASYANLAARAFGDGPFTFIRVDIPTNLITTEMRVTVDRGVPTVVLPSELLPRTTPPMPVAPVTPPMTVPPVRVGGGE
jgi:hypothetical protein